MVVSSIGALVVVSVFRHEGELVSSDGKVVAESSGHVFVLESGSISAHSLAENSLVKVSVAGMSHS